MTPSESGTNELEVEEARVAVDTVVEEVSARFRDLRKILSTVPGSGSRGASGNSAGLRRGADGGRRSSGGGVPGEGAEPSLADAEGGLAGGFGAEGRAPPAGTAEGLVGRNSGRGEREEEEVVDGPEDLVFPRELGGLPRQLFHLRRGPLLGPLLQNSDDPLCLRHLFLRGSLEDCLRMMAPEMFSLKVCCFFWGGGGQWAFGVRTWGVEKEAFQEDSYGWPERPRGWLRSVKSNNRCTVLLIIHFRVGTFRQYYARFGKQMAHFD